MELRNRQNTLLPNVLEARGEALLGRNDSECFWGADHILFLDPDVDYTGLVTVVTVIALYTLFVCTLV